MHLAIEIGGSKLQLCAGHSNGEIVARERFTVDRAAGATGIQAQILSALPGLIEEHNPRSIGIGYGGPVDWRSGRIVKSYHIAGWNGFAICDWITELTGLPCFAENDTNAAAFGEATLGAGVGKSPVFYTNMGSGVGGGLVIDGQLYHGAPPGEVEFGHLRLSADGTIVEDRCSGWAVDRRLREVASQNPESELALRLRDIPRGGEAKHLPALLAANDEIAWNVLNETTQHFAFALSHVVQLFHPAVIVVGGGLANLGEPLRSSIKKALSQFVMDALLPPPPILLAKLGEDAVPVGVLALAERR